ncbi:cytochrome b [Stygiobacter electus]|uniref:Cytochrome b N-terminal domain-containing protein n=1 Tax=Stygiobacter electus TaxID=3032292 RepID=A0AAE3NY66_9BACT|nr:cytochrome b N-terminal domain-containing protein [Stygiobacter electus]MDF1612261.1 cytochrome b N-terminal domain-containing protein [Stygiobacter electus]
MKKLFNNIYSWIDERVQISDLVKFMSKKYVPIHSHSIWYYFGGVSLFFFIIQVVTGILLTFYYKGSSEQAYESIKFIMSKVEFGWLIRSIHAWSANLFIFTIFIHMFSVFFERTYRKPRELTWVTGVLLFFLSLSFGFSGYLLPWNELAYFATKVGTDIVGVVPIIGEPLKLLLRGSEDVTGATLSRFFAFHVMLLPLIFSLILFIHLLLVQIQGMSEPVEEKVKGNMPFFPNFFLRDLILWLLVLNILAVLAVFFPSELGLKANPLAPAPAGIKPEWYFMFMFQSLKFLPSKILFIDGELLGILLFGSAGVLWLLVPFWDRKTARGQKNRLINYIGIFAIIFIIVMTILGWVL